MVLSVGCYRESERVIVYDSETKIEKTFTVDKIELSNIGTIVKFFESLKKCVTQKTIDFLCILMNYEYTTEYRKTFLENAQQFGIINVRIIGSRMASFIEAINALSFTPKTDDNLWIFYMQQKGLFMDAWKSIYVKVNNAIMRTISSKEILPFSTEVLFDGKQNDIITVKLSFSLFSC
uniref:Uncharacterized protein n=1 Tax=Panagrolaimus superbus TaxID=310955 RepID=A0A914XWQ6_9BILA